MNWDGYGFDENETKNVENKLNIREKIPLNLEDRSRLIFDRKVYNCLGTMPSDVFISAGHARRYKKLDSSRYYRSSAT